MKEIEQSIFEHTTLLEESLLPFGFIKEGPVYRYSTVLPGCGFPCQIVVAPSGEVDGTIYDGQEEYEGYRRQILGEYNAAIKEEYVALLKDIRSRCFALTRPVDYYLVPSNPKIYDIDRGFKQNQGYLDWPCRKKLKEGDVCYIYSAVPFRGIRFRCLVVAVGEAGEGYGSRTIYPTIIRLDKTFPQGLITLEDAKTHGLKTVRFFHKMNPEVGKYFDTF